MASRDAFSSYQSGGPPEAPDRRPSENVESSPPRSLSLSSSSETLDRPTSSETTSQDNGGMPYRFPVNCPPFLPAGFFVSGMPNPMIGQQNPLMSAGMPLIPGPVVYQSPMSTHAMNYRNGFVQQQMVPAPPIRGNYPRPSLPFAGGSGLGAFPGTGAPHVAVVPVFPLPAPMMFEFPMENVPTRFPFAPVAGPPRMSIEVHTRLQVNFVETVVSVVIQVLHAPQDFEIRGDMIHASVESPSRKMIECRVRESDSYIVNTFAGSFRAEKETGNYRVDVTMTIPPHKLEQYRNQLENPDGTIRGSGFVVISRNYGLDSQRDCLRLRCEYGIGLDRPGAEVVETSGPEEPHPPAAAGVSGATTKLWGLTCDLRNNNLYYTDRDAHVVRCMDPKGNIVLEFGQNRLLPGNHLLRRPCGIEFDGVRNRLIVCDKDNHRVCFYTLDGHYIGSFGKHGHANGCFEFPWDVAVAPNGTIAVSDSRNKRVQFFDVNGNYLDKYTIYEMNPCQAKTEFYHPRGVCFDKSGNNLYVTDFKVNNVIRIRTDSMEKKGEKILPQDNLCRPQGITVDNTGNLLVCYPRRDCIRYFSRKGERLSTIRQVGGHPLSFPVNVTTMAGGYVAVLNGDGTIIIF